MASHFYFLYIFYVLVKWCPTLIFQSETSLNAIFVVLHLRLGLCELGSPTSQSSVSFVCLCQLLVFYFADQRRLGTIKNSAFVC